MRSSADVIPSPATLIIFRGWRRPPILEVCDFPKGLGAIKSRCLGRSGKWQIQDSKFKRKATIMPINHHEITEDMERHIRKFGGAWEEWCVGTAKDSRGPFFQRHREADLGDALTYREAYTTDAAQAVVAHLVNDRGLELDRKAVPESGKIVFVHRKTPTVTAAGSERPTFHKLAA